MNTKIPLSTCCPGTGRVSMVLGLLACSALMASTASAAILRVAEGASGAGNGTSWTDAYPKLQDALSAAVAGDEIWVASGVYYPDERSGRPDGTASSTFTLKASVPLYGGFARTETSRVERNPESNVTVLSGDIAQDDANTDGNRIAEISPQIVGTNSSTVVRFVSGIGTARLDGFTVTASSSGGLFVARSGLTAANCRFTGNKATSGGGTVVSANNTVFTQCAFSGNSATTGAAAYVSGQSTVFTQCTFSGNSATTGAAYVSGQSTVFMRCAFSGNSATTGAAAYVSGQSTVLSHCVFSGNSATQNGGAVCATEATQTVNCLFYSNMAATYGGAWYQNGAFDTPVIAQCTMTGNTASFGGAFFSDSGQVALRNSILWGNTATGTSTAVAASIAGSVLPTVSRCNVSGSGGSGAWSYLAGVNLGGNLDVNPSFLGTASPSAPTYSFRTLAGSPVIDAGTAANLPADNTDLDGDANLTEAIPVDLAGDPRSVGTAPDMGVFETGSGPAIIGSVPVMRVSPNSGTHAPALDLSDIFDASAQTFSLTSVTPSTIATVTVNSLSGEVSITPLTDATGVATIIISATNSSGRSNYLAIPVEVFPAVIYVDADATGSASGLSWSDAFPTLQAALVHGGSSHEIWVAEGVYFPDQGGGQIPGNTAAKFVLPAGITLRGGFAGTESSATQANPTAHPTVLSADVGRDDTNVDGNKVAETTSDRVGTNATSLLTLTAAPANTGIDGFVLTAAGTGGALKISGGSPFVRRCQFSGNSGTNGGAVLTDTSATPAFTACVFSGNVAATSGGAVCATGGSPTFEDCSFSGNVSNGSDGGGALYLTTVTTSIRRCTFSQNLCPSTFGAGGAIRAFTSVLMAVNCSFRGNEGYDGGALHITGGTAASLTNCFVQENLARSDGGAAYLNGIDAIFTGCVFATNRATSDGGALYHHDCSPTFAHCTLAGNAAGQSGGAIYNRTWNTADPAAPVLRNCILWGNQKGPYAVASGASVEDITTPHATTYSHCIIAHSGGSATWNSELGIDLGSNLDADPRFLMPHLPGTTASQAIDLRVHVGSPAINCGNNSLVPTDQADADADGNTVETLPVDLAGRPRIVGASVDMGAYEAEAGPGWLTAAPRLRFDTFSGAHINALAVSTLFDTSAAQFAIEAQSSASVIITQVGASTGDLDITVLPERFGTTLVVIRATDSSGRSSYQTVTVDVYPPAVFVKAAATGSANGLSWQNAFPTLQAALQFPRIAGFPLEIWVAQGVYRPDDGPGQVSDTAVSTFQIPPNCRVYGGFAGNEAERHARNPPAHPTILSGDLAGDDLNSDGNSVAETVDAIRGINAACVVDADACLEGDTIDSFIITAADGGSSGSGLSCTGGTLSVVACQFEGNRGISGGGVSFKNATAFITDCRFSANRADARGRSFTSEGGAAYFFDSVAVLNNCRFIANQAADSDGGIGDGGAVKVYGGAFVTLTGCDFENTVAGGALRAQNTSLVVSDCRIADTLSGGGLQCLNTATTLIRCVISGNHDGGLNFIGEVPLTCVNTVISGNSKSGDGGGAALSGHQPMRFTNCLITGNSCWNFGGGIDSWASDSVFTNCTFTANRSTTRGGAFYSESGSSQSFINCILWENQTAGSTTSSFATLIGSPYSTPPAHFRNCIVANSGGSAVWNTLSGYDNGGNLDADPRFLVPLSPTVAPSTGGDFQIAYRSPALDTGHNAPVSATTDLFGAPRIINGTVDMGVYEGQNDQFDLDGDGLSDAFELAATFPPSRTALDPAGDADQDGQSNLLEFALGRNPLVADKENTQQVSIIEHAGNRHLSLRYRRNRWAMQFLDINVERSSDLGTEDAWNTGETTTSEVAPLGDAVDEITERSLFPVHLHASEFLRLHIQTSAP